MKRFLVMMLVATTLASTSMVNMVTPSVQAVTMNETSVEGKENLIKNGDFSNGTTDWGYFTAEGGKGSVTSENGVLKATVKKCGDVPYGMQVYNQSFPLYKGGKYVLKFDISSSINREVESMIQLDGGDYRSYTWKQVSTSPKVQTVVMEFTMEDETDVVPKLCFNLGKEGDEELSEHSVTIDNVGLYLVDDSNVDYSTNTKEEEKIVLNELGYLPNDFKQVVFRGDVTDKTFNVVSKDTGKVVYTGEISAPKYNEGAKETDYYGDFSKLTTPGTYKITTANLGESYEFKIGNDVYKDVFKDAQKFFYYQRCEELIKQFAGKWSHPKCHTSLATIYGTDEKIDVSGGWHDAGDFGRYVVATSKTLADLIFAYNSNKEAFTDDINIPESGNGQADILDEVKPQFEWLFKMQNKENGGVYHKVTCASFPGTIMPEEEKGELIVCPITTTATGDFAAVMALAYDTFKDTDKAFAEKCLSAAEKAYDYLDKAPSQIVKNPDGIVTGEYGDTSDRDERYWAAAQLFKATGKSKYNEKVKELANEKVELGYDWALVGCYGNEAYFGAKGADSSTKEKIKAAVIKEADRIVSASKADGYGVSNGTVYYWGSNSAALNEAVLLQFANSISPNADYVKYAKEHINYCFGKNANAMSFVTGYGTVSPKNPHHRPSQVVKEAIPGMIIGGVNSHLEDPHAKAFLKDAAPAKCYLDNEQSYSTNEVDIYWNSALVHALAKTYMVGNKTNQSQDKTEVPVTSDKLDIDLKVTADNVIRHNYTIKAKNEEVDLSKVGIRYYFSKSDNKPMLANCNNAGLSLKEAPWYLNLTSNVNSKIGSDEKGSYVEFRVDKKVKLKNDESTLSLETTLNNTDWSGLTNYKGLGVKVVYYN